MLGQTLLSSSCAALNAPRATAVPFGPQDTLLTHTELSTRVQQKHHGEREISGSIRAQAIIVEKTSPGIAVRKKVPSLIKNCNPKFNSTKERNSTKDIYTHWDLDKENTSFDTSVHLAIRSPYVTKQ